MIPATLIIITPAVHAAIISAEQLQVVNTVRADILTDLRLPESVDPAHIMDAARRGGNAAEIAEVWRVDQAI
eukprot:7916416-Heterocapsa_arctica.AAC.1